MERKSRLLEGGMAPCLFLHGCYANVEEQPSGPGVLNLELVIKP